MTSQGNKYPIKHIYCFKCISRLHRCDFGTIKSSCSTCFNVDHCNKTLCCECLIDYRMELKKNIVHCLNQCRLLMRKNENYAQEIMNKLENMKIHMDLSTLELIDQVDTYYDSILTQIDKQKFYEETNTSSGYESLIDQQLVDMNSYRSLQKNITLTEPSIIPIHLLGEFISTNSNSSPSQILWSMACSFHPSYLIFEPDSSKLFICSDQGYVSIYNYTKTSLILVNTFYLQYNERSQLVTIKSVATSKSSLIIILNSSIKSILQIYSHHGCLLHSLSFFNEYINQIRFDKNDLWCLELISSTLFYFSFQSNDQIHEEKTEFISFKQQSFKPYRFAVNQTFVIIIDRSSTGIILIYDKQTKSFLKQIQSPLIDFQPCDIELTNQLLIYRYSHMILLTYLDNEQYLGKLNVNKNLNVTIGKSDREILVSTLTDDHNKYLIQCYI